MRRSKVNLTRASVAQLQVHLERAEERVAQEEARVTGLRQGARAPEEPARSERRLDAIARASAELTADARSQRSFMRRLLLLGPRLTRATRNQLAKLDEEAIKLRGQLEAGARHEAQLRLAYETLTRRKQWAARVRQAMAVKLKKKARTEELKAAAASGTEAARRLGHAVKQQLTRDTHCPYCCNPLGEEPHADHIYPIAKGGRSVRRNMVLVCASCNTRKGHLTLTAFILKYGLSREGIEERLAGLDKDF